MTESQYQEIKAALERIETALSGLVAGLKPPVYGNTLPDETGDYVPNHYKTTCINGGKSNV